MSVKFPIPLLMFADIAGLNEPLFATFRLGRAWSQRVGQGSWVFIGHKDQVLGAGVVQSVDVGRVGDMLRTHAHNGHLELALRRASPDTYNKEAAPDRRFASLSKTYGPHRLTADSWLSVVYLNPR